MTRLDFSQPPFDVLSASERASVTHRSKVLYLDKGQSLSPEQCQQFYVVLKGHIEQRLINSASTENEAEEFVADYSATDTRNDWFDARKPVSIYSLRPDSTHLSYRYTATDQSLLLQVEAEAIDRLSTQNHLVRHLLSGDISERVQALEQSASKSKQPSASSSQVQTQQLILQPISQLPLLPVHQISADDSLLTASQVMTQAGLKHLLVHKEDDEETLGIITDADICRAVSQQTDMANTSCQHFAKFELHTITSDQDLSDALLKMIRYRVHRLPVIGENGQVIGVLGQSDLLAYLSNNSQLISTQIEHAQNIEDLHLTVEHIGEFIRSQHANGIKIGVISRMVQTLNAHVFTKLWQLIVPSDVFNNTCVIVMGSEGRGEQIMRTDQDNALILSDGFEHAELANYADRFNQTLARMGYPLCDGNIMMTNPMWRCSISQFKQQVSDWFLGKSTDDSSLPNCGIWLSAVLDADYVCGDKALLHELKAHFATARADADPMFIRSFAQPALQFGDVNQWWQKFAPFIGKNQSDIDLKKAGIFPIVHGVRALAVEQDVYDVTSTKARLKTLVKHQVINRKRADELIETLEFFMGQRLNVALTTHDKFARQVDPSQLSALERDVLKDCLNVVKSFKGELQRRYHLEVM